MQQRAKNIKQVRNIHAKNNAFIVVGDVSLTKLAKAKMAKSFYDAGCGIIKKTIGI